MLTTLPPAIEYLRKRMVVEPLRLDTRSTPSRPLGLSPAEASAAISWGQANFDEPSGNLSPRDRVLLYAYWNQKRHLEELSEAFHQLFGHGRPKQSMIIVDLGCGPFTGGLALAGQLDPEEEFEYIGVDRSKTMLEFGKQLAAEAHDNDELPSITHRWVISISDIDWQEAPGWRPVVIIVSFLLASQSLEVKNLIGELHNLLARLSRGEATVIYTNSVKEDPNRNFPTFRDALLRIGFRLQTDEIGEIQTVQKEYELRYALFHRNSQRILRLGGD